jgi:hypothetical protein
MSRKENTPADRRIYAICRNDAGALRLYREAAEGRKAPAGWEPVEAVVGLAEARQRLTARAAERDAERARSVEAANRAIRRVISPSVRPGVRFRVTEEDLAAKGLAGVLSERVRLSAGQMAYLNWVDAGRPAL